MASRATYIVLVVAIFILEIVIARGVGGAFVRGSVGDVLVIVLLYFLVRAISKLSPLQSASVAIALGFLAEGLQYIHLADLLGLKKGNVLYIAVGNTYSPSDLVMYMVGGILAFVGDRYGIMRK
ncbi:MAG: DUF2809 domain-containing protein [Caldilineaceae bacterium]